MLDVCNIVGKNVRDKIIVEQKKNKKKKEEKIVRLKLLHECEKEEMVMRSKAK